MEKEVIRQYIGETLTFKLKVKIIGMEISEEVEDDGIQE